MAGFQYYRSIPGMTQAQAETAAKRIQTATEAMELEVTVDAPGNVGVTATMTLSLSGTGTIFDQSYNIETVHHQFSANDGYRMTVVGKSGSSGGGGG